ncbi:MAG: DUF2130 domain-containing protein, partial [Anaeroplasmataceae bacterium]|nr:DUF2130 domain-containing protein [Anaeroplasmataceae bacterium]
MKKIEVLVRNKNTLILEEDAQKGDYIDLTSITNVDYSQIEKIILDGKDTIYNQKLKEYAKHIELKATQEKKDLEQKYVIEQQKLNSIIERLKKDYENQFETEKKASSYQHSLEISSLKHQITSLNDRMKDDVIRTKQEAESKYSDQIHNLSLELERSKAYAISLQKDLEMKHQLMLKEAEGKLETLKSTIDIQIKSKQLEIEKSYEEKFAMMNQMIQNLKNEKENLEIKQKLMLEEQLHKKDEAFAKEKISLKEQIENLTQSNLLLQRQKASLNVKQTGEDLESWCDNEVRSYMQNGFFNCTWEKDNQVIRNEDETKGSKADYLFSIFASKDKDFSLAKVCLDMKDENPDSVNRKKNSDYYRALDSNRKKKDCKYAVLVSNLELDKPNDLPIFKVNEHEDMYVVRPAYLMTFLNMLVSLTTRFADLVLSKEQERLELKSLLELKETFERLKNTYLDKPLDALRKNIEEIQKQNDNISKASRKIEEYCDTITRSYLNEIENKLSRFDLNIT